MGIDIESIDQNKTEVIKKLVVAGEAQVIMDSGLFDSVGFTALWTIKEALSKIIRVDHGEQNCSGVEKRNNKRAIMNSSKSI